MLFQQIFCPQYSAMMTTLIIVELVTMGWLSARFIKWLQTDEALDIIEGLLELKDWSPTVQKFLEIASFFFKPLSIVHESMNVS